MKIIFPLALTVLLASVLPSCDDKPSQSPPPTYPPPTNLGNGTVLIFDARDTYGNFAFHSNLNQYFADHPDQRFVSMEEVEHDVNNVPTKYVIIVQYITQPVTPTPPGAALQPVPPATQPAVAPTGEINYPSGR